MVRCDPDVLTEAIVRGLVEPHESASVTTEELQARIWIDEAGPVVEDEDAAIEPTKLYSIEALERLLRCSRRSVYAAFDRGLRWSSPAGTRVVLGSDLLAFVKAQRGR